MSRSFTCLYRYTVPENDVVAIMPHLVRTNDPVFIGSSKSNAPTISGTVQRLDRYTIRGVPGRLVDVCVHPDYQGSAHPLVAEVGRKEGRFNGASRWRVSIRHWRSKTLSQYDPGCDAQVPVGEGRLSLDFDLALEGLCSVRVEDWSEVFPVHPASKCSTADIDPVAVLLWQYGHYYHFLPSEEVESLKDIISVPADGADTSAWTLVEWNRFASRSLYRLAVDLGWKKLTEKDRRRYGIPPGVHWLRRETFLAYQNLAAEAKALCKGAPFRGGTVTGAGQFSHEAAAGHGMRPVDHPE